jgi:acyl-[acyl carrier protein]--UDP-N-acetylglucosamine O-acyltransferase
MVKYELTDETTEHFGHTLKRVRYLDTGELGGFIESSRNLSQEGGCKVLNNAKVYNNAIISGDAIISGNAKIYGYATAYGNATVYGNAEVLDYAMVLDCATVYCNAKIFNNAIISDSGAVYGDAKIYDRAQVYGRASVYGDAEICGDVEISGGYTRIIGGLWKDTPLQIHGTKYHFNVAGEKSVSLGGIIKTAEEWRDSYKEFFRRHKFSEKEEVEYILYFNLASQLYGYGFTLPLSDKKN